MLEHTIVEKLLLGLQEECLIKIAKLMLRVKEI
jgi:hypothetical protein